MDRSIVKVIGNVIVLGTLCWNGSAALGEDAATGPNLGKISLSTGFDITTEYLFRGIFQEDQGAIVQPWFEIGMDLLEPDAGPINSVGLTFGLWNSLHSGPTGSGDGGPGGWYEADAYIGLSFGLPANLSADVTYVYLGSPDPAGSIYAEEFDFTLAYDDSGLWSLDLADFSGLQPSVMYVVEVDGASDGVGNGGDKYLEIGIGPSFTVLHSETMPVTMTIPVVLGLSLDDYYESPVDGSDDSFGFLKTGVDFSFPLSFLPGEFGQWSAHTGLDCYFLGNSVEDFNDGSNTDFEVVATFGMSMEY